MTFLRKKLACVAVAAGLTAAMLTACSSSPSAQSSSGGNPTFRLATSTWVGFGPWYIAEKKGFFADHGVDVKMVNFDDSSAEHAAVSSGQVDGANFATNVWLNQLAQGTDLSLVMMMDRSTTADAVLGGPGIGSVQDLVGKSVAYQAGSTSELLFYSALAEANLDPSKISHTELPAAQAGSALIAGQVQGAVTYEPYISTALGQKSGATVIFAADKVPGIISDGLVVKPDYLAAHPDAVTGLTESWNDAVKYLASNPEDGRAIIAEGLGAQVSDLETAFQGVDFYTRDESASALGGEFRDKTIPLIANSMTTSGVLKSSPEYSKHVTTDFVK